MNQPKKIAIIGGVAGGMSAATRLRRLDAKAEITVFERSSYVSYANCGLPYFLGGVIDERDNLLLQTPETLHARFDLDVRVGSEIVAIDRASKKIRGKNLLTNKNFEKDYDTLILSPGASPIKPQIQGIEKAFTLRTVEDVDLLVRKVAQNPNHVTVIGAGFIGVETAENLRHRNIAVSLIEAAPQVLAPLDIELANLVATEIRKNNIDLHLSKSVVEISNESVKLADGEIISTDLVVLAIGVKPETRLAEQAGLEIGPRGGIKVNEYQQTSDTSIYAIGDAAEKVDALDHSSTLIPLANIANRHGRVVADHICGHDVRPVDSIGSAIVKVFDLTAATTGWNERKLKQGNKRYQAIHTHPGSHAGYYPGAESMHLKLLFDPSTKSILGAQAVGKEGVDKRIDVIATAIRAGLKVDELSDLELCYAPPFGSAKDPINMLGYIADNMINGNSQTVQWHEVEKLQNEGALVIDVRTETEYALGHIPNALNIPVDQLRERLAEIPKKSLIVNCQVGQRGHTASMLLNELGFVAANLDGGYVTWKDAQSA